MQAIATERKILVTSPPAGKHHARPAGWRYPSLYRAVRDTVGDMKPINLAETLATFSDHWQARTVGVFNGHDLMVVKVKGEFIWHKHDETDDFFLVLKGRLTIRLREGNVTLGPGEMFVVPKGAEHCPVAEEEVHMLLIEPTGTPNTGDAQTAAPRRVL